MINIKKKNPLSILSFFLLSSLTLTFYGCRPTDKSITLSNSVQEEIKVTQKAILEALEEGNNLLTQEKFDDAKASFEKAISFDRSNSNTYIKIKDNYLNINRLDDAYYFIKLAIDTNVDKDNMLTLVKDLKSKFETPTLANTVNINSNFSLPSNVEMNINGKIENVKVKWDSNVDTSKVGTFSFTGTAAEYDRNVIFNLTVREPVKEKKVGFITNLYEKDGKSYIDFDETQFFLDIGTDKTATNEAIKDGISMPPEGYLPDCYYIKNIDKSTKKYILSKSVQIILIEGMIKYNSTIPHENVGRFFNSNYTIFKQYVSEWLADVKEPNERNRALFFWIYTEDDIITKLEINPTP